MFKTTYYSEELNCKKIDEPYRISFETTPDISRGVSKQFYNELTFSNKKEAAKACEKIDLFLSDVFFYADVIYYRLLSIATFDFEIKQTKRSYLAVNSDITEIRTKVNLGFYKNKPAYKSINELSDYILNLIHLSTYYFSSNKGFSEKCFAQLHSLHEYFINSYRNCARSKDLKHLNFLNIEKL